MKTVALKDPNTGLFTMMQLTGFGSISADDRSQYMSGAGVFSGDWYMSPGNSLTGNSTNLLNQWVMLSIELDVPNARATASLNATAYNTNVAQSGLSTMGTGNVRLNDYQNNADSDWGEAIFVEDATQTNSDKIEGYLAHKWGLTSNLPSNHPYKTTAP